MRTESCLFIKNTERCQKKKEPLSNFCAQHQNPFSDLDNPTLLEMTLKCLRESIYIDEQKRVAMYSPLESPEKKEIAAASTNYWNTLIERGYQGEELLRSLGHLAQTSPFFEDIRKEAKDADPKWKRFEKLLAGIHLLKAEGAKVTFNDHITGKRTGRRRQIDVSLRFSNGYYEYLVVVECKDYEVPIDDVEAFRTKLEDVGGRGILVSSKGFQKGAKTTAEAYGIELFTLTEEFSDWTKKIREDAITVPFPEQITFDHPAIPGEASPQHLAFDQLALYKDEKSPPITMAQIITDVCLWARQHNLSLPCLVNLKFPKEFYTRFPGTAFYTPVYSLRMKLNKFEWRSSKIIDIPPQREKYIYADVAKEKIFEIPPEEIPIGVDTVLEPGKFYTDRRRAKYRCIEVNRDRILMVLLESKQNGETIDIEFVVDTSFAYEVIPFTDPAEIARLEERYQFLKQQKAPGT